MSVSRREALFAGATLPVSAVLWKTAYSQTPAAQPAGTQPATKQPTGRDPLVAVCMLVGGRRQIEVCKWAMEKLSNADCKAFAKAEVDEHEHIKSKMKEFGLEYPTIPQTTQAATNTQAGGVQQVSAIQPIPAIAVGRIMFPPPASDFVQIDHEICEQCIANYKKDMEKKQGAKFDKCFASDQLHAHHGLLDKVQVFKKHASGDMLAVLSEGQQVIEKHIATLEQIVQKLDDAKDGEKSGGTTTKEK